MAIVQMRRLRVIAIKDLRRRLMRDLSRLGCVDIESSLEMLANPEWSCVLKRSEENADSVKNLSSISSALESLSKYAPAKTGF